MTAQATSLTVAFGRHGIHPTDAPGFKSVEQLQIVPKCGSSLQTASTRAPDRRLSVRHFGDALSRP
jgi:hypothetical protein